MNTNMTNVLGSIAQQPQCQGGTVDQLRSLWGFANRLGLYDAADFLRNRVKRPSITQTCADGSPLHAPNEPYPELLAVLEALPQLTQRQDGTNDQLVDLRVFANRLGLYDAADYLRSVLEGYAAAGRAAGEPT